MLDALRRQLDYLAERSAFYRRRLDGVQVRSLEDLRALPFTTKAELRAGQERNPPFGEHLCAPREALVRMHVTSGTTGTPVAVGFTRVDHERNSAIGGAAFRIAGLRPDDTVAHCLNYALYAGGVADHMALEASGATVVPVGVGESRRLLDLIPRLGITALFGTLSYPAYLAGRAREAGVEPRTLGLRHVVTAGEPGAGLAAVRREIEDTWAVTVADTFGMSDVWSTMAGECEHRAGMHLTTGDGALLELCDPATGEAVPLEDGAAGELVWTHLHREASPLLRYRSGDLARVWTGTCACGRSGLRLAIEGRADDMLRVQAVNVQPQAIGALLERHGFGRFAVIARGDPIVPPLEVLAEAGTRAHPDGDALEAELRAALGAAVRLSVLAPGTLPVAEQKTRLVYRADPGEPLPPELAAARPKGGS